MPAIDIDRDAAHDAAQRELAKPIYPRASLWDQLGAWLDDVMHSILARGASFPGGWLTITVLLLLAVVAVIVAFRVARRTMHTRRSHGTALFGSGDLSSAEHRARAQQFASRREWTAAIQHRVRAVARHLEETAVLRPVPGRTATELARDAGLAIPGLSAELRSVANAFNDVTYGDVTGTEPGYRMVVEVDDQLVTHSVRRIKADSHPVRVDDWVEVR